MSSSRQLITQAWSCILPLRRFVGESVRRGLHSSEYWNGNRGYKNETSNGRDVESGFSKLEGYAASGHRNFESGGLFGRRRRCTKSQNHDARVRKPKMSRARVNSGKRGFRDGFRMPEFDPGNDQLKKIFESQIYSNDSISELDLEEVGTIEGNFRDDDDSEVEDFYKNA